MVVGGNVYHSIQVTIVSAILLQSVIKSFQLSSLFTPYNLLGPHITFDKHTITSSYKFIRCQVATFSMVPALSVHAPLPYQNSILKMHLNWPKSILNWPKSILRLFLQKLPLKSYPCAGDKGSLFHRGHYFGIWYGRDLGKSKLHPK